MVHGATRLADVALRLANASGLEVACSALEAGRLTPESTAVARSAIAQGSAVVEGGLRTLQEVWGSVVPRLAPTELAVVLRASAAAAERARRDTPSTQVVWTGPAVDGSFLRATREVVREILRSARTSLLVVGYWIVARDYGEGIIEEVISSLADSVVRGVKVCIVVDERRRDDGRNNREVLLAAWPSGVRLPTILTWRLPSDDQHLKLHAKVIVADRRDALVTSANLTAHAMNLNIEMGVRIGGQPAQDIAKHFDLLEASRVLEPFSPELVAG